MQTEKAVKDDSCGVRDVTLQELAGKGNFFAQNFYRWQALGHDMFSVADTDARNRFGDFLYASLGPLQAEFRKKMNSQALVKFFQEQLPMVENDIAERIAIYTPADGVFQCLRPDPEQMAGTSDPIELIHEVSKLDKNKPLTLRDFRMLRTLEISAFYFFMAATRNSLKPFEDNDDSMSLGFMKWMDPDLEYRPNEPLEIGLDQNNRWRLVSYRLNGFQMPARRKDLSYIREKVLLVSFHTLFPRKTINVIVEARRKGLFEAFAKRFRDIQSPLWPDVTDLDGIRIIYQRQSDMRDGLANAMLRAIWNNNPETRFCRTSNKHSQKTMRIKNQRVFANGRHHEFQHIRIEDWLSIKFSTAPENHTRYHLRWHTDEGGLFNNAFPPELYGIAWTTDDIRKILHHHVINAMKERNEHLAAPA